MSHVLNSIEGLQLSGRSIFVDVPIDQLDRLGYPTRSLGFPDFAITASANALGAGVAGHQVELSRHRRNQDGTALGVLENSVKVEQGDSTLTTATRILQKVD